MMATLVLLLPVLQGTLFFSRKNEEVIAAEASKILVAVTI
jgi:hypothetical protein